MGHDDKHCQASLDKQNVVNQYGDWLKAYGNARSGNNKPKSFSSNSHGTDNDGKASDKDPTYDDLGQITLVFRGRGTNSNGGLQNSKISNTPLMSNLERARLGTSTCQATVGKAGRGGMDVGRKVMRQSEGPHDGRSAPTPMEEADLSAKETPGDALSKMGQSMKETDVSTKVTSPHKPRYVAQVHETSPEQKAGQMANKAQKGKGQMKKIAREKGLNQGQVTEVKSQFIGIKRQGSLTFPESEGSEVRKKKCEGLVGNFNAEDLSVAAAMQRRQEP